jgi:hypothetical protein
LEIIGFYGGDDAAIAVGLLNSDQQILPGRLHGCTVAAQREINTVFQWFNIILAH